MIAYRDVVDNDLIDKDILAFIPRTCECGGNIEFTESLKQISCDSPKCYFKIASRLESMCKNLQADGFGESSCIEIVRSFNLISPYQVVLLKGRKLDSVAAFSKKIDGLIDKLDKEFELWEVVSFGNIPSIDSLAYKIFGKYSNLRDAYLDIETYQVPFVASLLGVSNGVMACNIYNTLIDYKSELMFAEKHLRIKKNISKKILIAITGSVNGYSTKASYVSKLNSLLGDKATVVMKSTVSKDIDYLVCDGDANSNKFKTATRLADSGCNLKILQSNELEKIIMLM